MSSKRRHEGWFFSDNRAGPGTGEAMAAQTGLPMGVGAHRGLFEAPTITCSHCQVIVVLSPTRDRERAYCMGCDHYICDKCGIAKAAGAKCYTYKQKVQEIGEAASKGLSSSLILTGE